MNVNKDQLRSRSSAFSSGSRPRRRSAFALIALGTVAALGLAGCSGGGSSNSSATAATGDITVAVVADLTGAAAASNATAADGMRAAVQAVNAAGGVKGRNIKLDVFDSKSTPDGSQVAARQAVADEPSIIAVAALSSGVVASQAVYEQAGIPVMTVSAAAELLDPLKPWYFTAGSTPQQIANGFVSVTTNELGTLSGKKIAFNGLDSSTTNSILAITKTEFEAAGATIVDQEKSSGAITSFTSQAQKIVSLNADAVISVDLVENFVIVGQALTAAGFTGPYIGTEGASSNSVFQRLNNPLYLGGRSYMPGLPGSASVVAAAAAGVDPSGPYFSLGWAVGNVIAEASKNCANACGSDDMTTAVESISSYTPPGDVTFGPLSLSKDRHYAVTAIQYFNWDSATQTVVKHGGPIEVK
ncbi:hypothetical protein BH09ACT6_BH09ACT6_06770 [soil metagenome]